MYTHVIHGVLYMHAQFYPVLYNTMFPHNYIPVNCFIIPANYSGLLHIPVNGTISRTPV